MTTARAVGTVKNTGNARSSYRVTLYAATIDDEGDIQESVTDTATVTLDPGEVSQTINLSASAVTWGGWRMVANLVLDMTSPVVRDNIDSVEAAPYTEGASYGGTWSGTPTIGAFSLRGGVGRIGAALVAAGSR